MGWRLHSSLPCNFAEGVVMVTVIEKIVAIEVRYEQIDISVVVIIGSGDCFGKAAVGDTSRSRNILKPASTFIQEQLCRSLFISYKQIEQTVIVDIHPNRSLRGTRWISKARQRSCIFEGTVAIAV